MKPIFEERSGFFYAKIRVKKELLSKEEEITIELAKDGITSKELAKKLKISERTAREILRRLFEKGILRRERVGKGYVYHL